MRTVALTKESTKDILENLLKRSPNNYGKFEAAVDNILKNVKEKGDEALFAYTKEFDKYQENQPGRRVFQDYHHRGYRYSAASASVTGCIDELRCCTEIGRAHV